jgi:alpha-beta hydrolase superfamily lysophospholipase
MTADDIAISHEVMNYDRVRIHRLTVTPPSPWTRLAFFPGYGDHAMRYLRFFNWMAQRNVACSAIDFRGHGVSTGRRGFIRRWDEYLDDVTALLNLWPAPFVVAHSHGALVVAMAALRGRLPQINCVFSAPYFKLKIPLNPMIQTLAQISSRIAPAYHFKSGVRPEILTRDAELAEETRRDPLCLGVATPRWFLGAQRAQNEVVRRAAEFSLPLLMLIPAADQIADPAVAEDFFRRAASPDKILKIYPDHQHELFRELTREKIYEDIRQWMLARTPQKTTLAS